MDSFTNLMNSIDSIIWCMVLVVLCLGAGLYFSIRMKFPQVRLFKEMARLLASGEKSDSGITPFQAFAATVGSRVGMGNIAGVATAIFFGGPVYFIERALHCKPYAAAFAVVTILGPGILMPGQHINSIASTFQEAFESNVIIVGAIFVIVLGLVICGGIKRIGRVAEYMASFMCVIYVILAVGIIVLNITKVPSAFAMIFRCAFGADALYGAIIGSALSWGLLSSKGIALLKDYEEQKKQGKDPMFNPEKFGISDETHVWDKYKNK